LRKDKGGIPMGKLARILGAVTYVMAASSGGTTKAPRGDPRGDGRGLVGKRGQGHRYASADDACMQWVGEFSSRTRRT